MTVSPSPAPVADRSATKHPPVWWRRTVGALVFALASAVMAVAALTTVFAPVELLWPDDSFPLAPGAVIALGLAGLLALIGLWGVLRQTLHSLGVPRSAVFTTFALGVPLGYAIVRAAVYGTVLSVWWTTGLSAACGVVVCLVAASLHKRRTVPMILTGITFATLIGGVVTESQVTQTVLRAEYDRYSAIPVLRHPDWTLTSVEPHPEQQDVLVEYRHVKKASAQPIQLYVYRPEETNGRYKGQPDDHRIYQVIEYDGFTVLSDPFSGPVLHIPLDISTRVQVVWEGASQEDLVELAGYIGAATDVERAELRGTIGASRYRKVA